MQSGVPKAQRTIARVFNGLPAAIQTIDVGHSGTCTVHFEARRRQEEKYYKFLF